MPSVIAYYALHEFSLNSHMLKWNQNQISLPTHFRALDLMKFSEIMALMLGIKGFLSQLSYLKVFWDACQHMARYHDTNQH